MTQGPDMTATLPAETGIAHDARHEDASGKLLPADVAAVELINVLRPTVAVAHL